MHDEDHDFSSSSKYGLVLEMIQDVPKLSLGQRLSPGKFELTAQLVI